jgi:hypothetical protein
MDQPSCAANKRVCAGHNRMYITVHRMVIEHTVLGKSNAAS